MALNLKKLANYIMITVCLILFVINTSLGQDAGKLTSFKGYDGVHISKTDHIRGPKLTTRQIPTSKGLVKVSRLSGTRIIYVNNENVPFVNIKVETSSENDYSSNQKKLLEYFNHIASGSDKIENKKVAKISMNGYTLYGFTNSDINNVNIISSFIFFPKKNLTVFVDFNSINAPKNYKNLSEFKKLRDLFLENYTLFISK